MELVYVWVEKFRNIENQGFILNPNYKVNFTSNTKHPGLTVELAEKQPTSFFEDKIKNVTVFIGKNGSGKSNLLDLLGHRIRDRTRLHSSDDGYFILYHVQDEIYVIEGHNFQLIKNMVDDYPDFPTGFPIVTNTYSMVVKRKHNGRLQYLHFPQGNGIHESIHVFNIRDTFPTDYRQNSFIIERESSKFFQRFNVQSDRIGYELKYKLFLDLNNRTKAIEQQHKVFESTKLIHVSIQNNISRGFNDASPLQLQYRYSKPIRSRPTPPSTPQMKTDFLMRLLTDYVCFTIQSFDKDTEEDKKIYSHTVKKINKLTLKNGEEENYLFNALQIAMDGLEKSHQMPYSTYFQSFEKLFSLLKDLDEMWYFSDSKIEVPIGTSENPQISAILQHVDTCRFNDEKLDYLNGCIRVNLQPFSSGEEAFINLFASIHFAVGLDTHSKKDHALILLDEPDRHMHPEWSRCLMEELFELLNTLDGYKSYHLIVSTHSPFIVSDVPKYAVTALSGKSGSCRIEPFEEQTFGNNIHTLLTEDFFMSATIGEFALRKINDIIARLNSKKPINLEEIHRLASTIQLIGEPIIQSKLFDMLHDRDPETRKRRIREQIEKLQSEHDSLGE